MPDRPLLLLLLTVPGGVVRHDLADAIAARLAEITELMYGVDDGRYGMTDLGRLTEMMAAGFRCIAASDPAQYGIGRLRTLRLVGRVGSVRDARI